MPVTVVQAESGDIDSWRFWNPNTGLYQDQPPTISPGQEAGIVAFCRNTAGHSQRMRLNAVVQPPRGGSTEIYGEELSVLAAGILEQGMVWTCDQEGVYQVTLVLYAGLSGELLAVVDVVRVLEYARCSHYFTDPPNMLGVKCVSKFSYHSSVWTDPRVIANDQLRRECANEVAQTLGVPFWADKFYYPGWIDWNDIYYAIVQGQISSWQDYPWINPNLPNMAPPELAVCCSSKVEGYWNSLSDKQKLSLWIEPAYQECAVALAYMNGQYANQWAPITIDDLVQVAAFLGNFDEEAARWAAAHRDEYPWV